MRNLLLVFIALMLVIGCSTEKATGPQLHNVIGEWTGTVHAIYPGPVDEPLEATGGINFIFNADGRYFFFWYPWVGQSAYSEGNYEIRNDSIILIQTIRYTGKISVINPEPYNILGTYFIQARDSSIMMHQIFNPHDWPTEHTINLQPGQVVF